MRLYEVTEEPRYLALTNYFVEQRGAQPHYYDQEYEKRGQTSHWHTYGPAWMVKDKAYSQAHLPIAQQQTAIGHAVRFVYLMTGVAHLARLSHDESKRQDCLRLWNNMAQRQLYITGGIGSQSSGEAFSSDYDLPNDTVYAEVAPPSADDVCPTNAGNGRRQSICRCDGARTVQHRARRHGAGWQTFLLCESAGSTSKIAEIQPYLRSR